MVRDIIVEATSKLPFAGRHQTRGLYLSGREAARNGEDIGKVKGLAYLGGMALSHALLAKFGVDTAIANVHKDDTLPNVAAGYDMLYAAANCAVTYTQAKLLGKLAFTTSKGKREPFIGAVTSTEQTAPQAIAANTFSENDLPKDLAVTLASQALFAATVLI